MKLFPITVGAMLLTACVTTKPCTSTEKVWVEEQLVTAAVPGSRRIGGIMAPRFHTQIVPGHWRTVCVR